MKSLATVLAAFAAIAVAALVVMPSVFNGGTADGPSGGKIASACTYAKDVEKYWGVEAIAADPTDPRMVEGAAGLRFHLGDPPAVPDRLERTVTRFYAYLDGKEDQAQGLADGKKLAEYLRTCKPA